MRRGAVITVNMMQRNSRHESPLKTIYFFLNNFCHIANLPKLYVMVKRLLNESVNVYYISLICLIKLIIRDY